MRSARLVAHAFYASALFVLIGASGCTRKVGYAVVLEKEHIDAAEPRPTPTPVTTLSEKATVPAAEESPTASPANEPVETELAPDEIVVDTYVMKKNVRGTSKDPRASSQEKWLMKVEMVDDLRRFTILAERAQFLKYKIGDRVRVSYKLGKYTGTVWDGEIEE